MTLSKKRLIILWATVVLVAISKECYAKEGFVLIKNDVILYQTKECKTPGYKKPFLRLATGKSLEKYEKPLYKFTYGEVKKRENGKIYVKVKGYLLEKHFAKHQPHHGGILAHCEGWMDENNAILFEYSRYVELYDKATRIFLKQGFPD